MRDIRKYQQHALKAAFKKYDRNDKKQLYMLGEYKGF